MLAVRAEDWPRVSALLDQALELAPDERVAWLDALPADAAAHREALAELLKGDGEGAAKILSAPRFDWVDAAATPGEAPAAGDDVGPYRLLSEIGRGGMGAVWLAERRAGSPRRQVALKLPRTTSWDDALGTRLRREGDILASLEHPNIARLYDAGLDAAGRPYLAIEYVRGVPIDTYAQDLGLETASRVRLLLQVADAVSYAHGRLVIHRDLKPANILVDDEGRVRLLDFGIAKLLDGEIAAETALTRASGRAMTLDYASPEQVRGDPLTTASDVYSLGVVAYEVLSGAKPYRLRRGTAAALEEAIVAADVPPASSQPGSAAQKKALRGDLDAILNKALKKDLDERYPNVDAFALDLRRHLAHEPVAAQPDRWRYRAGKFAGRYRLQLVAASVAIAALAIGLTAALTQATRAQRAAAAARSEADRREQIASFMQGIFSAATLDTGATIETKAVDLLTQSRKRVPIELAGDTELQHETLATIGNALFSLDDYRDAIDALQQAVAIDERTPVRDRLGARIVRARLAHARVFLGQLDEAQRELAPLLAAGAPVDPALAIAQEAESTLLLNRNEPDRAVPFARAAVATWDRIGSNDDRDRSPVLRRQLQSARRDALLTLARAEYHADANAAALVSIDRAIRELDAAPAGTIPPAVRAMHVALRARILRDLDRLDEAAATYRSVMPVLRAALGARSHQAEVDSLEYALVELRRGRYDDAVALYREAVAIAVEAKDSPRNLATVKAGLGQALAYAQRHEEAAQVLASAAADLHASIGEGNVSYWTFTAEAALEEGFAGHDLETALREATRAYDRMRSLEPSRRQTLETGVLATAIATLAELADDRALATRFLAEVTNDPEVLAAMGNLNRAQMLIVQGRLAVSAGDTHGARSAFDAAAASTSKVTGERLERAMASTGLARVALREGRTKDALQAAAEADALATRLAPASRARIEAQAWHGRALVATGDAKAGKGLLDEAKRAVQGRAVPADRSWLAAAG